jgi:outer membrane lipoprotein-sorting protein
MLSSISSTLDRARLLVYSADNLDNAVFIDLRMAKKSFIPAFLIILLSTFGPSAAENRGQAEPFESTLKRMKKRFDALQDYLCLFESSVTDGHRTQDFVYRYFFKKPNLVRVEVVSGENAGATLIVQGEKVRAKPAGLLSLLTFTFRPDHPRVTDIRKNRLDQTPWGYFIEQHLQSLDHLTVLSSRRDSQDGREVLVFDLSSRDPAQTRGISRETIWVSYREALLLRYEMFDGQGRPVQTARYTDIVLDPGLPDSLFTDFRR